MFSTLVDRIVTWITKVQWRTSKVISSEEVDTIRAKLTDSYYIILTRHSGYLSTFAIAVAHFIQTGRWGYYSHVLMNLEDEVKSDSDFRLIEATGSGVHYSSFTQVFDPQCSSVALLKPKSLTLDEWTQIMDGAKVYLGRPYDTLFDLTDDRALSCVELVRSILRELPDYKTRFAKFEDAVASSQKLTPHMFFECDEFEIVYRTKY